MASPRLPKSAAASSACLRNAALLQSDMAKFAKLIKDANIKVD